LPREPHGLPWNYGILHTSYTDHSIGSTTFHCHINHAGFTRTHRLNFELHWRQPLLYVSSVIGKIDFPTSLSHLAECVVQIHPGNPTALLDGTMGSISMPNGCTTWVCSYLCIAPSYHTRSPATSLGSGGFPVWPPTSAFCGRAWKQFQLASNIRDSLETTGID